MVRYGCMATCSEDMPVRQGHVDAEASLKGRTIQEIACNSIGEKRWRVYLQEGHQPL